MARREQWLHPLLPLMRQLLLFLLMCGLGACGAMEMDPADFQQPGVYLIRDSGVRCEVAPCPTLKVSRSQTGPSVLVVDIYYPDSMPDGQRHELASRVFTAEGLRARGRVVDAIPPENGNYAFELESAVDP